ncbi:MAG TPA: sigma-70 family RNA polymerase sigma factor [Armatimonadota bacterium]|jgi:RNA polymerase sigma-70 factor (ECF subfamily)
MTKLAADDALAYSAARGDEEAFAALLRRHRGWVRSLLTAFTHDRDMAEDLTQEVFCRAHRALPRYAAKGSFVPWLKGIAVNLGRDHLKCAREARYRSEEGVDVDEVPAPVWDPVDALASEQLHGDLRTAIQGLPEDQRLALILFYFGAMSLKDVAWAQQCPVGTVKSRLHYGLRQVRASLLALWTEEGRDSDDG